MKTQGETEKYIHRGALSLAPFQWLTGQLGRQKWREERREIEADRRYSRKRQPVQVTHKELEKTSEKQIEICS